MGGICTIMLAARRAKAEIRVCFPMLNRSASAQWAVSRNFPAHCKLFDYMTANFDNYVTLWQHCITVSAATERASQGNSKILTLGRQS